MVASFNSGDEWRLLNVIHIHHARVLLFIFQLGNVYNENKRTSNYSQMTPEEGTNHLEEHQAQKAPGDVQSAVRPDQLVAAVVSLRQVAGADVASK
jgi:hypothetical protein